MLIDYYTSTLDVLSHPPLREIDMNLHPFTPFYQKLSSATCGYVYLLCSIPDSTHCYLEQCNNLKKRLCEHNTRYGMIETLCQHIFIHGVVFAFIEVNDIIVDIQRRRDFVEYLLFRVHLQNGQELVYNSIRECCSALQPVRHKRTCYRKKWAVAW